MFMMCLQKVLGFGLPEEDSAVLFSVLINPRMKKHRAVFRQFCSDQDWFYSIVRLHIIIHFMMTVLILPTLSSGTKDNGSGVWKHVCVKALYWWDLHWTDQKTRTLHTGEKKKYDCSFYLDLETKCSGSSPASDFCSFMLQPLESPALDWGHWVITGGCHWSRKQEELT